MNFNNNITLAIINKISLVLFILVFTFSAKASVIISTAPPADKVMMPLFHTGKMISLARLISLKPSEYKELTGKKMNFKEKISLKIFQHHFKDCINNNGTVNLQKFSDDETSINQQHWLWFALGFLLGPIGFIISLFIHDDSRDDRIEWTVIGFGSLLLVSLVLILIG
jgi:hypothetical protein